MTTHRWSDIKGNSLSSETLRELDNKVKEEVDKIKEKLVDDLIDAACYQESCKEDLIRCEGYHADNLRRLELAETELLEARKKVLNAMAGSGEMS